MSPEEKHEVGTHLVRVDASFSGPLPPPEALERYNRVLPGAAERILKMAEDQEKHRHRLEDKAVSSNAFAQKAGVILGFILALIAITGGIWLAYLGKSGAGLTTVITAVAGLVGVFIYGKHEQRRNLVQKSSPIDHAVKQSQSPERFE